MFGSLTSLMNSMGGPAKLLGRFAKAMLDFKNTIPLNNGETYSTIMIYEDSDPENASVIIAFFDDEDKMIRKTDPVLFTEFITNLEMN